MHRISIGTKRSIYYQANISIIKYRVNYLPIKLNKIIWKIFIVNKM